jgi:SAM-dependent methyltransferase
MFFDVALDGDHIVGFCNMGCDVPRRGVVPDPLPPHVLTGHIRDHSHVMDVRESYDSAAEVYAQHLASELVQKPLDRHLLNRFAEETRGRGLVADLGCGPGHVAKYLHDQGVTVVGFDVSPQMIRCAANLNPGLEFRVGDMRALSLPAESLVGLVAFYSIVHFESAELGGVMLQLRRVLAVGGLALVSFHIGEQVLHVDNLFGAPVNLDFRFHAPRTVTDALRAAQFAVIEHVEREPYAGAEYQSRRCYLLARAV